MEDDRVGVLGTGPYVRIRPDSSDCRRSKAVQTLFDKRKICGWTVGRVFDRWNVMVSGL